MAWGWPVSWSCASYTDLAHDARALAHRYRGQVCGVVGVPRSGMLAASIVALELNLPLVSLGQFLESRLGAYEAGWRFGLRSTELPDRRVLIVDDSLLSGETMRGAMGQLASLRDWPRWVGYFAAVYGPAGGMPDSLPHPVGVARELPSPRFFEWNVWHSAAMGRAMLDLDGVLCEDPPLLDDGGLAYSRALREARPLHIPTVPVRAICTARLEPYRQLTKDWLRGQGVTHGGLHMGPWSTPEHRRQCDVAAWKAAVYGASDCTLFVESDAGLAERIALLSRRAVLCPRAQRIFAGGA